MSHNDSEKLNSEKDVQSKSFISNSTSRAHSKLSGGARSIFSNYFGGQRRGIDDPFASLVIVSAENYRNSFSYFLRFLLLSVLSLGILPIMCIFNSYWYTRFARKKLKSPRDGATHVLVQSKTITKKTEHTSCKIFKVKANIAYSILPRTNFDDISFQNLQPSIIPEGTNATLPTDISPENTDSSSHDNLYFEWKHLRYVYNDRSLCYDPFPASLEGASFSEVEFFAKNGRTSQEAKDLQTLFGQNTTQTAGDSLFRFLFLKCANPYYILLIFSIGAMYYFEEYVQASVILALIVASISWEVSIAWANQKHLKTLFAHEGKINVLRDKKIVSININDLVIGDLIYPESGSKLPCDMVLTSGLCAVDDSARTGEESPEPKLPVNFVTKTHGVFSKTTNKEHVVHSGSVILHAENKLKPQADHPLEGVVCAIGFSTDEGIMFRRILNQKSLNWRVLRESFLIFLVFTIIAFSGLAYPIKNAMDNGAKSRRIGLTIMKVLSRVFPPYLPIMLTVGAIVSATRLKRQRIECIDPEQLAPAGLVELAAFDKTGTLTDIGITFNFSNRVLEATPVPSIKESKNKHPSEEQVNVEHLPPTPQSPSSGIDAPEPLYTFMGLENVLSYSENLHFERCLATCHGCIKINKTGIGNPLDTEGIIASAWQIVDPSELYQKEQVTADDNNTFLPTIITAVAPRNVNSPNLNVVFRTGFESEERRQTVIVSEAGTRNAFVYMKGAPEHIIRFCRPYTVPEDFHVLLKQYNKEGYYVIGMAYKPAPTEWLIEAPERKELETLMYFLGFALFRGNISADTHLAIDPLVAANIAPIIITGDSPHSGVYVGRNGGILDPLARVVLIEQNESLVLAAKDIETNETVAQTFEDLLKFVANNPEIEFAITGAALTMVVRASEEAELLFLMGRIKVYARIKPLQKLWIIRMFRDHHIYTGMIGDGANDCGALREADVSLALSRAEASMVAIFTSLQLKVSDIVTVIKEARCSLETTYVVIRFLLMYTTILLVSNVFIRTNWSAESNIMFLFDDIGLILPMSILMVLTKPSSILNKMAPYRSAINLELLFSMIGQIGICIGFTFAVEFTMKAQPWFCSARTAFFALLQCAADPSPTCNRFPCYVFDPWASINREPGADLFVFTYETTTWWQYAHFQMLGMAFILNLRSPHRKSIRHNIGLVLWIVAGFIVCSVILLVDYEGFQTAFPLVRYPENSFRWKVWGYVWAYYASALFWEICVVQMIGRPFLATMRMKYPLFKFL